MRGESVIIEVVPEDTAKLVEALTTYAEAAAAAGAVYADVHRTKAENRLVLIELHDDETALASARARHWRAVAALASSPPVHEPIRPVMSAPIAYSRPVTDAELGAPREVVSPVESVDEVFGAHIVIRTHPHIRERFLAGVHRVAAIVAANEPGYLFADMYETATPGRWVMVEYYRAREALSLHHTLDHTHEWAAEKTAYEAAKHHAFTLRPLLSLGRFPRRYREGPDAIRQVMTARKFEHDAGAVWSVLRDFGGIARWAPVERCTTEGDGEGMVRTVTAAGMSLRERLEFRNDETRRLVYTMLPGENFPAIGYHGSVRVVSPEPGRSEVEWRATFSPQAPFEALEPMVHGTFAAALEALDGHLGGVGLR